ncbi:MAG: LTXXQ domain protein [Pseudomonas sp.]|uniref:LTXXQ domain protein n=1 Tax=Pseudomonas sp. TaxID=306 RepID=UPI002733CA26|nr:LTXXQ domain protein [Pseudomonas sp.]MDP3846145.1 LTXXQ domain protein [Pseudomonas sp.]
MRKSLIALLFAASLPALAHAMPEDGQRQHAERGQHLFKQLNLDQQQRMAVGKLMREQMQARHSITQSFLDKLPAAEQKAMQEQLAAAKAKNDQAIRALLNPEQQKAYDDALKQLEQRRAVKAE